jgi:hypothetical protein
MTDPFLDSLATAVAGQAVTALSAAAKAALHKIGKLLRRRTDPETRAALEAAAQPSAGQPEVTALAQRLDQIAKEDREFGELLRTARNVIANDASAGDGGVVNQNTGNVENLIQARDISGPITFH